MDFIIPEDFHMMTESIRRFVERDLEPITHQVENEDRIPEETVEKIRELGLFGLAIPERYDGLGLGVLGECLVYEELSKTNACFRSRIGTNNGIGSQGIVIDGTEEQKQVYLLKPASGEWTACFALSEPEARSDAAGIRTRAELEGDHWVLNGRKHFITNGDIADVAPVFAVTDPEKRTQGGISLGHPIACTGTRVLVTLLHEMRRPDDGLVFYSSGEESTCWESVGLGFFHERSGPWIPCSIHDRWRSLVFRHQRIISARTSSKIS